MSHDVIHAESNGGIPRHMLDKQGFAMPVLALLCVVVSIFFAVLQGSFVVGSSGWGHVWPSSDSAKVQLPPANLTPP